MFATISAAQSAANAANSQKSTGPRTEAGKNRTRLNAYRHGLTGQIYAFNSEDREAFDKHCRAICEALAPVGAIEIDLAQAIAEDRWRMNRARAIEYGIFAEAQALSDIQSAAGEAIVKARAWLTEGKSLQLLTLYAQRIHRSAEKNMAELRRLQEERKAAFQQALAEAQVLAQAAHAKGEVYDSAQDFPPELRIGFDFSTAQINRLLARAQRLTEARNTAVSARAAA